MHIYYGCFFSEIYSKMGSNHLNILSLRTQRPPKYRKAPATHTTKADEADREGAPGQSEGERGRRAEDGGLSI